METPSSAREAWLRVLSAAKSVVTDQTYRTWIAPLRATSLENGELTLEVPNPFYIEWLEEHHRPLLEGIARRELDAPTEISFSVSGAYTGDPLPSPPPAPEAQGIGASRPLEVNGNGARPAPAPAPLNGRFTFQSFVVGKSNEFCFAACEAIAKRPGHVYNPLFIYAGVGLGKTHIMQAIGNHIREDKPDANVCYLSSEKFMNEMIQSIRMNTTFDFKRRYRSADLLLIDDIQFLAGKESTQEEFFHTFNTLYDAHRQIVITSDRPPKELRDLEERLVSRFNWGLVTDMNSPDFETRVAILRRRAEREHVMIPDDVILLIAERITNNVRELEGSLVRLSALASLTGSRIDRTLAERFLQDLIPAKAARMTTPAEIRRKVCERFGVPIDAVTGKRRTNKLVVPRQVAMYITKKLTGASLVEIGRHYGNRDHTTVLYACERIDKKRQDDPELDAVILDLLREIVGTNGACAELLH